MNQVQYVKSIMQYHNDSQIVDALQRCQNNPNAAIAHLANLPSPPNIKKNLLEWFQYFDPSHCGGLTKDEIVCALHLSFGSDLRTVNFEQSVANIWTQFVPSEYPNVRISSEVFLEADGLGAVIAEYIAPIYLQIDEIGALFPKDVVVPRQHIHDVLVAEGGDMKKALIKLQQYYPLIGTSSSSSSSSLQSNSSASIASGFYPPPNNNYFHQQHQPPQQHQQIAMSYSKPPSQHPPPQQHQSHPPSQHPPPPPQQNQPQYPPSQHTYQQQIPPSQHQMSSQYQSHQPPSQHKPPLQHKPPSQHQQQYYPPRPPSQYQQPHQHQQTQQLPPSTTQQTSLHVHVPPSQQQHQSHAVSHSYQHPPSQHPPSQLQPPSPIFVQSYAVPSISQPPTLPQPQQTSQPSQHHYIPPSPPIPQDSQVPYNVSAVYRPPPNLIPPITAPPYMPRPPRAQTSQKALLVGCNYVGQSGELRGCANDVLSIKSLLTKTYGWSDSNKFMRILSDGKKSNTQPTKENIMAGLKWLVDDVQPGDALFFHFSGHGSQQPDPLGVEEDGMNEVILPVDYRRHGVITDDVISSTIIQTLPDGVRLTVVLDACHSGTGCDLPYMWNASKRMFIEETNPYHSLGDVTLFSGCMDEGTSCDVQAMGGAGGAMTMAFVSSLQRNPNPTYDELLEGLLREMKKKRFEQKPQLSSAQEFDVGRPFLMNDALPNSNCLIGRTMRKKFTVGSGGGSKPSLENQLSGVGTLLTAMLFS